MKKRILAAACAALLLLSSCGSAPAEPEGTLHIVATTYPVYLFATAVAGGVEGVEVTLMVSRPTSCLHDYTLTVKDMKGLTGADVVVMNGAGLEDFMADALAQSGAAVVDCSEAVELLPGGDHEGHDGHDHDEEYDPHYWMNPHNAVKAMLRIEDALSEMDPGHAGAYRENGGAARELAAAMAEEGLAALGGGDAPALRSRELITFHDGFRYFARYLGLDLLKSIEEEEGAETSARELKELVELIAEYDIPSIFTEKNGSDATARTLERETGVKIYPLDMIMSGEGTGIQPYLDAMNANIDTILEALG